jgi:hypothetical protein
MKICAMALVLFALLALVPCTASAAQPPVPQSKAEFLATLAAPNAAPAIPDLPPAPTNLSTICHTNADCPSGQLCCYPCGIDGCPNYVCTTPVKGRCPLYV